MAKKTAAAVRAALANDPNTALLAERLKMSLEDYVKLVVYFATTGAQPKLFVVPDAQLKKNGHTPPDPRQMNAWLAEAAAMKLATAVTDYRDACGPMMSLVAPAVANAADPMATDPTLAAEIRSRRGGAHSS